MAYTTFACARSLVEADDAPGTLRVSVADLDHLHDHLRLMNLTYAIRYMMLAAGARHVICQHEPEEGIAVEIIGEGIAPEAFGANPNAVNPESAEDLGETILGMVEAARYYCTYHYERGEADGAAA